MITLMSSRTANLINLFEVPHRTRISNRRKNRYACGVSVGAFSACFANLSKTIFRAPAWYKDLALSQFRTNTKKSNMVMSVTSILKCKPIIGSCPPCDQLVSLQGRPKNT